MDGPVAGILKDVIHERMEISMMKFTGGFRVRTFGIEYFQSPVTIPATDIGVIQP